MNSMYDNNHESKNVDNSFRENIGTGVLSVFCSNRFGSYDYFEDDEYGYLRYVGNCFKIFLEYRNEVTNQMIYVAETIKKGMKR